MANISVNEVRDINVILFFCFLAVIATNRAEFIMRITTIAYIRKSNLVTNILTYII